MTFAAWLLVANGVEDGATAALRECENLKCNGTAETGSKSAIIEASCASGDQLCRTRDECQVANR